MDDFDFRKWSDITLSRIRWRRRLAKEIRPFYCEMCNIKEVCRRVEVNERIQNLILRGEDCPDYKGIWEFI